MPQLTKEAGATEELKASDPMKWVGLMNTCKAQAEEILMRERRRFWKHYQKKREMEFPLEL